jgi:hypothetical protein
MDILSSFSLGRNWFLSMIMVLLLVLSGFVLIIGDDTAVEADDGADGSTSNDVLALAPGQRGGDHRLADTPPEYLAYASEYYFGGIMEVIDINADGYEDLVVGHGGWSSQSTVAIFD